MKTGNKVYDDYRKSVKRYIKDKSATIKEVCRGDTPQHVLWKKEVAAAIEKELGGDHTVREAVGGFFFRELLVNKLMHFAYLDGAKSIDDKSYQKGWDDCRESLLKQMGAWEDESGSHSD